LTTIIPEQQTQPQAITTQQETSAFVTEAQTEPIELSTATPVLILTQEQQTNSPTTQSGQQTTGVTAELLVPEHSVHGESSETHPRTWKPHRGETTLQRSKPKFTVKFIFGHYFSCANHDSTK
jgi:hypothetical protein